MTTEFPVGPSASRRIGNRVRPARLEVHLVLEVGRWRRRPHRVPVTVDNMSVTGLGFIADLPAPLGRGQIVRVELSENAVCNVRVRHVGGTTLAGGTYYGVEFVGLDPGLVAEIHRIIHGDEPAKIALWESDRIQ